MQGATIDLRDEDGWHLDVSPELLATVYPASPVLSIVEPDLLGPRGHQRRRSTWTSSRPGSTATRSSTPPARSGWPYPEPPSTISNLSIVGSSVQFDCGWRSPFKNTTVFLRLKNQDGEFSNPIMFQVGRHQRRPGRDLPAEQSADAGRERERRVPVPLHRDRPLAGATSRSWASPATPTAERMAPTSGAGRSGDDWWLRCRFPDGPAPSTITLRVTDSDLISMTTQTVQIVNAPPTVELDDVTGAVEGSETWIPYSTADVGTDTVEHPGHAGLRHGRLSRRAVRIPCLPLPRRARHRDGERHGRRRRRCHRHRDR